MSPPVHNATLSRLIKPRYSVSEIRNLTRLLAQNATLNFPALPNGLFPAAAADDAGTSGYRYVWVRDNVYVAYAHLVNGRGLQACATARTLTNYFHRHSARFADIIDGRLDGSNPMDRPHIRFDGETLNEVREKWAHAQNDALGYYLWLICRLLLARGFIEPDRQCAEVIACMVSYLRAIRYWQDEDSGHWEETRKIAASSIGVVVGALRLLRQAIAAHNGLRELVANTARPLPEQMIDELIEQGTKALAQILPAECIQPEPRKYRECDGALLFLIYPIAVVDHTMADRIIERVVQRLKGDFGIRRYEGDSYWCADYKELLPPSVRTMDFSDRMASRDAMLKAGEEAQWCIFDPILSAIYGRRFVESRDPADLERQFAYLNRGLGQITPAFQCPEAYYKERGRWVPNGNTPLLWSQANLWIALRLAEESLQHGP